MVKKTIMHQAHAVPPPPGGCRAGRAQEQVVGQDLEAVLPPRRAGLPSCHRCASRCSTGSTTRRTCSAQTLAARPWARPTRTRSSRRMSLILRPCGSSAKIWARPRPRRLTACLSLHRPRRLKTIRHICRWRCGAALCCVLGIHLLHVQCGFVAFFRWYWRVSPGPRNVHLRTQGRDARAISPQQSGSTQCVYDPRIYTAYPSFWTHLQPCVYASLVVLN